MKKFLLILAIISLTGCVKKEKPDDTVDVVTLNKDKDQELNHSTDLDLEYINNYLFDKLEGVTLVRDYGEDSGYTNIIFGADGNFMGSYMGKKEADGFDAGLSDYAWTWYHGEEIHSSEFEGKFVITEQLNDHVFKMRMADFNITTEYGPYDDIYFNVDFALGIKPDADYYLYLPGTPYDLGPKEDSRLDKFWESEGGEKSTGFTLWNKYEDEIFIETH